MSNLTCSQARGQSAHVAGNPPPPRAPHWSPKATTAPKLTLPSVESPEPTPPLVDLKVRAATELVLRNLGITNRIEFLEWRQDNGEKGMLSRSPFYGMVKEMSPTHWATLVAPKHSCMAAYERALPGYKIYRK
jgi:hypothetical protein